MAIECAVIFVFLLLFAVVFARTKHKEWALATFPLTLVPLADIVLEYILIRVAKLNITVFIGLLILVIAVAASAAWIGISEGILKTKHKRSSASYVVIGNLFNVVLAAILIANILRESGEFESSML